MACPARPGIQRLARRHVAIADQEVLIRSHRKKLVLRSGSLDVSARRHQVGFRGTVLNRSARRKRRDVLSIVGLIRWDMASVSPISEALASTNGYDILRGARTRN